MPTNLGTVYEITYDIGLADKRGVTSAKRSMCDLLRDVMGHGANSLEQRVVNGRAKLFLRAIDSKHPDFQNHPYRVDNIKSVLEIPYDSCHIRTIKYWT